MVAFVEELHQFESDFLLDFLGGISMKRSAEDAFNDGEEAEDEVLTSFKRIRMDESQRVANVDFSLLDDLENSWTSMSRPLAATASSFMSFSEATGSIAPVQRPIEGGRNHTFSDWDYSRGLSQTRVGAAEEDEENEGSNEPLERTVPPLPSIETTNATTKSFVTSTDVTQEGIAVNYALAKFKFARYLTTLLPGSARPNSIVFSISGLARVKTENRNPSPRRKNSFEIVNVQDHISFVWSEHSKVWEASRMDKDRQGLFINHQCSLALRGDKIIAALALKPRNCELLPSSEGNEFDMMMTLIGSDVNTETLNLGKVTLLSKPHGGEKNLHHSYVSQYTNHAAAIASFIM